MWKKNLKNKPTECLIININLEYLMKNKEIQELVQNDIKNNMMDLDEWRIINLKQIFFELKQLEEILHIYFLIQDI